MAQVKSMKPQMLLESTTKDPVVVPTIDMKKWPRTMESMENYICGFLGVDKTPLTYATQVTLFPLRAADDLMFGTAGSVYNSINKEIIARHRIVDQSTAAVGVTVKEHEKDGPRDKSFRTDNTCLWEILLGIFGETEANVILKPHKNS